MNSISPTALLLLTISSPLVISGCSRPTAEGAAKSSAPESTSLVRVTAAHPQRKDLVLTTSQPASVEAFAATPLSPKVAGYVADVPVDIGDRVLAGQVLLRLDAPEMLDEVRQKQALRNQAEAEAGQARARLQSAQVGVESARARIAQAEAELTRADADLEQSRTEQQRISELAASRSVTQQVADESLARLRSAEAGRRAAESGIDIARALLQESEAAVAQSQADVDAAAARVEVAAANLTYVETMVGYLELKAPFDGVITERNVDPGHFVDATPDNDDPVLALASVDRLRVFADVPEAEAPFVTSGAEGDPAVVRVQALGRREFAASVTRTSWALDPANRSLRVEIDIDDPDGVLRPGMYATVGIVLEKRLSVLTVPATAVVNDGGNTYCCLVRDGQVARTPIELGLRVGDDCEVVAGLTDSDIAILVRGDSLNEGQAVEVIEPVAKK